MNALIKGVAAVALIAVGIGVAGYAMLGFDSVGTSDTSYLTSQATSTTVAETAAASGSLVAATTYELAFGETPTPIDNSTASSDSSSTSATNATTDSSSSTASWPVIAVNVAVGDTVSAGDVLAIADSTSAKLQLTLAQANLVAAQQQLAQDQVGGDSDSQASAGDSLTSAERALSDAKASYRSTLAQSRISLSQAKQTLSDARQQLADDRDANAPDSVIEQDKDAVKQARQSLASTRLQMATNNRQAKSQVASAELSLAAAQRGYTSVTTSADAAVIAADQVAINDAQDALSTARAALDAATIKAPIDGRVTAVNVAAGEDASGTAIELQSTALAVTISVGESDILSIAVGQSANVDISATGTTMTGTVTSIDPVAASSGTSSSVSYDVTVLLGDQSNDATGTQAALDTSQQTGATQAVAATGTQQDALPGMTAEVTVVTAQAEDAIAVPVAALSGTTGSYTVQVMGSDGTVETRSIEVGLITSSEAQVTSGLSAGETVVTGTSSDRDTTSTTSSQSSSGGLGGLDGGGFQPPAGGFPDGGPQQ